MSLHCISFYFLLHFCFDSLAYVCRKLSVLFLVLAFIFNLCKFYVTGDSYFLRVICLDTYLVLITSLYAWFPYHTQSDSVLLWLFLDVLPKIACLVSAQSFSSLSIQIWQVCHNAIIPEGRETYCACIQWHWYEW